MFRRLPWIWPQIWRLGDGHYGLFPHAPPRASGYMLDWLYESD